jgi:hypothetical protein
MLTVFVVIFALVFAQESISQPKIEIDKLPEDWKPFVNHSIV